MDTRSEMLRQLRARRGGFSLPQSFYGDPAFHQLDLESIYYREWLFVGHECELVQPGAYFTVNIGSYNIVVLKRDDGTIGALHNSCRHRGSRVCAGEKGKVGRRLICPYHQWTYHHDGSLATARYMGPELDREQFGLKRVHCETLGGYIFVSLASTPPDFSTVRAEVEPYLLPHNLREAKVAFEMTIVEKGNWKLVWENNRECYHCAGNHPELLRTFPEKPTFSGLDSQMGDTVIRNHWMRCEKDGLPSTFRLSQNGQHRTVRLPLLEGAESFTMDGRSAVTKPLSNAVTASTIGSMLLFHYPSTWNHVLVDHAVTFRVLPLSPTETQLTTKWLVHKDAVEGVDYDLKRLTEVWIATNDQDRSIVEGNQLGISSPAYEPGPYCPDHEAGVMQFVDWYCRTMEQSLDKGAHLSRVA
jgi:Rieske 2Fe-2S family protein